MVRLRASVPLPPASWWSCWQLRAFSFLGVSETADTHIKHNMLSWKAMVLQQHEAGGCIEQVCPCMYLETIKLHTYLIVALITRNCLLEAWYLI